MDAKYLYCMPGMSTLLSGTSKHQNNVICRICCKSFRGSIVEGTMKLHDTTFLFNINHQNKVHQGMSYLLVTSLYATNDHDLPSTVEIISH
jgi:hypothetical protein